MLHVSFPNSRLSVIFDRCSAGPRRRNHEIPEQAVQDSVAQNYETLRYRLAHANITTMVDKEMLAMPIQIR